MNKTTSAALAALPEGCALSLRTHTANPNHHLWWNSRVCETGRPGDQLIRHLVAPRHRASSRLHQAAAASAAGNEKCGPRTLAA